MTDFLLELRSEEIPARMQTRAREDLAKLFAAELAKAGLRAGAVETYATPRRLTLIARGLPEATEAVSEELKGPRASAPPQALEGFLRKTGLAREQLVERDGVLFAVIERPGRATADVLAEAMPAIVRAFPWPKSMRWGAASLSTESLRWVRPLQGIVALFGEAVVPCEVAGIASGRETYGHRFMAPGAISIESAATYAEQLRAARVIVDQDERAAIIRDRARALAAEAGLALIEDQGLVAENAGLTEWPVPLLGRFDEAFLSVPPEVIQLTARVNQKYFVCRDGEGKLANAFICVANIEAVDGGAKIVEGNRKVLAARLSDARFFYEQDLRVPLDEQREKLDRIVFHEKLGTVADKAERVAKLARWLCEEGIISSSPARGGGSREVADGAVSPSDQAGIPLHRPADGPPPLAGEELASLTHRAALLCKADLVTGMVGEFPELQGVMGGYYAAAQGEHPAVAAAIRDHYKPVGAGDDVPTEPVAVAVSLADKLDTITAFFGINERPTGSKDPFALRRAALGVIRIIVENQLRLGLRQTLIRALSAHGIFWWNRLVDGARRVDTVAQTKLERFGKLAEQHEIKIDLTKGLGIEAALHARLSKDEVPAAVFAFADMKQLEIVPFFGERLSVQQREAGVRHDLIDAVFALGGEDDLVRLLARVRALQAFVTTEDGANLLAGYKRAANILKKEGAPAAATATPPPQTGEEDPLVEVDDPEFAPIVAELARGDRHNALGYTPEPAEEALIAALDTAEPAAKAAVAREDFEGAMAALSALRAPIDAFFDQVTVNDPEPAKRSARLALLARVRDAVHQVADFSKIEG
ncbi:MAG: glycine--tRNA ligase subunit beta [Sphingomonas sp.]|uniref:glycine--tRNA ligase subunit beta n=1 Tax=Sphingomonas sp. TaxID=28214 RepID=UPI0025E4B230|nr:glycine--tRNA ligase subunit beta [Sphingomonas sp.]MBX9882594.1 glycine--tRNA ligase subunit beta [Sphingomonas sp.]